MKKIITVILIFVLLLFVPVNSSAEGVTQSYNYDTWGNTVPVPSAYDTKEIIGYDLGLNKPNDMHYSNGNLYVLDNGNSRIAVLDSNYQFVRYIERFNYKGENLTFNNPNGIFVSDSGTIAVCDTGNARVVLTDIDGNVNAVLERPESEMFPKEITFTPVKAVIDDLDNVYVLSEGFYYGAVLYNKDGEHCGFFGANKVEVTAEILLESFWRNFMTDSQLSYSKGFIPTSFISFDIDSDNFIYTCSGEETESIKKLNYLSNNILVPEQGPDPLNKRIYGDRQTAITDDTELSATLTDIAVTEDGLIFALNTASDRIFHYDEDSNLLSVFGASGSNKGTFTTPVAVDTVGEDVLVLDMDKGVICVFSPTDFGKSLNSAVILYQQGLFEEALEKWNTVLKYNAVSELAYRGIGRAYLQQGKYSLAMEYAQKGQDRSGYSKAFRFYRSDLVRENIVYIIIAIIALIAAYVICKKFLSKKPPKRNKGVINVKDAFFHPVALYEKLYSSVDRRTVITSFFVVAVFFLCQMMQYLGTGFVFNQNNLSAFNGVFILIQSVGLVFIWTVSDIVVSSFRFGHGTVKKNWCGTTVALIPYIISVFINLILSNALVYEEKGIMTIITVAALLYSGILLFQSVKILNNYTVKETLTSLVLNIIVCILIILLVVVVFVLMRQLYIFGGTIFNELLYRIS